VTLPVALSTALAEHYRVERALGAGGMATVYLATDLKHDREVALKVLRPELAAVLGTERFLAEIKITARLDHPHILTLIDSGEAGGYLYYVLPLVRGESLRDKLNREKQLGLEESLTITRQVASALDYAHRHGVIHRDIKPENILLLEGEAMLADFGIALAVKEAGGNRLTETGLSLGTPMYMSPEQATGDRQLDARSDVYSLAAVLYEMLAGEPPVTGPNAQAMIAKLMTEKPVHLKVVRDSVPAEIDAAVSKALDKTPADRFHSAGEFSRALELKPTPITTQIVVAPGARRGLTIELVIAGVIVAIILGVMAAMGKFSKAATTYTLRDRTQLTFTGTVYASAISADGKQLAYITHNCTERCSYAVDVQDVGGTTTHRVMDGATAAYGLEWSPDRRNLLLQATRNGRWGIYLLSALGGEARFLTAGAAMFWAGGDSLLIAPSSANAIDSVFYVRVTSIQGLVADSIRVAGPGKGISALSVTPGNRWIVALVVQAGRGLWQVFDRSGKVADKVINSCTCPGRITGDALWLTRSGIGFESIIRIGIDPVTGKLASHQDTLLSGKFNNFSVTADGSTLVLDDGTDEYNIWAVSLPEALKGKVPETARLARGSNRMRAQMSPGGNRVLLARDLPSANGGVERRYSILPCGGGTETPVNTSGGVQFISWRDSVSVQFGRQTPTGLHLTLTDVRDGSVKSSLDLPDSLVLDAAALADGWAWVPAANDRVVIQRGGKTVEIPIPAWFLAVGRVSVDPAQRQVAMMGWNRATSDSLGVAVAPIEGGKAVLWGASFAEEGSMKFLDDGSIYFTPFDTPLSQVLYRVRGPGQMERLGAVPRTTEGVSASGDLKRAAITESVHHGDAYMSRVVQK
jgi:hypothetical protein